MRYHLPQSPRTRLEGTGPDSRRHYNGGVCVAGRDRRVCSPRVFTPTRVPPPLSASIYPRIGHWRVSLGFSYALFGGFTRLDLSPGESYSNYNTRLKCVTHSCTAPIHCLCNRCLRPQLKSRRHRASSLHPTGKGEIVPLFYLSATELRTGSPIAVSLVRAREAETLPIRQGTRTSE